jgi:hypothetical protein
MSLRKTTLTYQTIRYHKPEDLNLNFVTMKTSVFFCLYYKWFIKVMHRDTGGKARRNKTNKIKLLKWILVRFNVVVWKG